jgi:two-component system, NtrC family, nitrogen regulation sensor histidine kinase NtrY
MSRRRTSGHERQVLLLGLFAPLPAVLIALALLWTARDAEELAWVLGTCAIGAWLWGAFTVKSRVAGSLQSISSLLGALRSGDFSVRGHRIDPRDALGEALAEINGLAETLGSQRAGALEASALLAKVMAEIDVAVFAFDRAHRLKLINRAGERLLSASGQPEMGTPAGELGLAELLEGPTPRTVALSFAGGSLHAGGPGHWELRRSTFRLEGRPHELLVLADLRRALREEERQAWHRIIKVMGHEINNSLAPIRSLAADLQDILRMPSPERPADFERHLARGLAVIDRRSLALDRFMTSYARLAKLPPPRLVPVDVAAWLRRVVELEQRMRVRLGEGPDLTLLADGDQLDQLLINLIRNGVDAALETGGGVEVSWRKLARQVEIVVMDEGPGVTDTHNLFVPFFTTKPGGSGIGLVLSRQICEAHGGTLTLEARRERPGAVARLVLPL